ncbi:MAG: hypothetical protein QOF09_652 [Alphaproteobacteria bacterium]|nr:hypothetical protein [Alphaproteobacteria bacterium]
MIRPRQLTPRQWLIVLYDLLATAAALTVTIVIRFENSELAARLAWLPELLAGFVALAAVVYYLTGLHEAKWRFTSMPELKRIIRASAILAIALLALDYVLFSPKFYGTFFFGKITIALYFVIQTAFLSASRIAYRYFREERTQRRARDVNAVPTLILGRADEVEVPLRAVESGAIRNIWPVGLLSPARSDRGVSVRGVAVLGDFDDLERVIALLRARSTIVTRLVLTPSAFAPGAESILMRARRLGLATSQVPALDQAGATMRLAPVAVEDLLLRPSVTIDYGRLEAFLKDKSVVVTGGGGSIGSDICDRVVTFGAARLLIVENSEPALYAVQEALATKEPRTRIEGRLADVRDRERIARLLTEFKPDLVFHAAALKHVPLLEQNWSEGIKTNVLGSINVADAAVEAGASAMVMISTDKAIEPVSMLGATKRFAEMYCLALDADFARRGAGAAGTRLISVRFGNVLASNGSVVPKFKAQIEAGGPVTVTHPEMVRYFMTIREACDLVVTAATHALGPARSDVSVYVLNMGQPVKILDLAERLIRLSGLEHGRDIQIKFTGIRPGERLNEILFTREEEADTGVGISGIVAARPISPPLDKMRAWLATLEQGLARDERTAIYDVLHDAVPDFRGAAA